MSPSNRRSQLRGERDSRFPHAPLQPSSRVLHIPAARKFRSKGKKMAILSLRLLYECSRTSLLPSRAAYIKLYKDIFGKQSSLLHRLQLTIRTENGVQVSISCRWLALWDVLKSI